MCLALALLPLLLVQQGLLPCDGLRTMSRPRDEDPHAQPSYMSDRQCPANVAPHWSMIKVGTVDRAMPQELVSHDAQLQRALYRFQRSSFRGSEDEAEGEEEEAEPLANALRESDGSEAEEEAGDEQATVANVSTAPEEPQVVCTNLTSIPNETEADFQQRLAACHRQQAALRKLRENKGLKSNTSWPRNYTFKHSTTRAPTMRNWTRPIAPPFQPITAVEYAPERFTSWLDWQDGPAEMRQQERNASGRVAIILTGLVSRLIFPELLKNVIASAALQGYEVDVFVSLVQGGNKAVHSKGYLANFIGEPMLEGREGQNLTDVLTQSIERAGGRVAKLEISTREEDIDLLPEDNETYTSRSTRLTLYSPYTSEVGRNVLRRYKTIQGLFQDVEERSMVNGENYTWVLETREDLLWITPIDFRKFNVTGEAHLFGIDCLLYGGVNDKALVYSQLAGKLLAQRYEAFYNNSDPLLDNCHNAESYLAALVTVLNVPVTLVPVSYIGAVSAMYRREDGELQVCMRKTNQMNCINPYYMPVYCDPNDHTMQQQQRREAFCSDVDV